MKKKEVDPNEFVREVLHILDQKGVVFLIKTGDLVFDSFMIEKLLEGNSLTPPEGKLPEVSTSSTLIELEGVSYNFDYINNLDEAFLSHLAESNTLQNTSKRPKFIYCLPLQAIQGLLTQSSAAHWVSSFVFLSEQYERCAPDLLHQSLGMNFGEHIPQAITLYFSELLASQSHSVGKLNFHASTHQQILLNWTNGVKASDLDSSLDSLLDQQGNAFLNGLPESISEQMVAVFLRAFVRIDQEQVFYPSLSQDEIIKLSQTSQEQVINLLALATSPSYQLLIQMGDQYAIKIPEYPIEWKILRDWIADEAKNYKQVKQLESLARAYFQNTGTLLSKEQVEQIMSWKTESGIDYAWKEKYQLDEDLISSYLLLSENQLEESLKKQQKKRSRLLKNSIRISIAVSIAFLLSSFTALIAYLERNSALKQQELALEAKEDADQAREFAEAERIEAVKARQNESTALAKAEIDRLLALDAKGQADFQKKTALSALEMAQKSELEASRAREIAEQNEQLANAATETAQINFKTSERLRNQQEARASALESLAYFANEEFDKGIELAQTAYVKNLRNGGFPLQSDIFFALLQSNLNLEKSQLEVDLEFPAKFISLSPTQKQLAVYTINGEIRLYATSPRLQLTKKIKSGYLQSLQFASETQILATDLSGNLSLLDLPTGDFRLYTEQGSSGKYRSLFKIPSEENSWIATNQSGGVAMLSYQKTNGFFKTKEKNGGKIQAMALEQGQIAWAEGPDFFTSSLKQDDTPELLFEAPTEISSISWSILHNSWILGLQGGQILLVQASKSNNRVETFSIHSSKISQIKIIPYLHDTELMFSTGYDGSIYLYVLDKNTPFASSMSSRISYPKHKSWVTGFVIDPSQKLAYSISNDRSLKLWPLAIDNFSSQN